MDDDKLSWYWRNRDRARAKQRAYYERNREIALERAKKHAVANPEINRLATEKYRARNLEKCRAAVRASIAKNKERYAEKNSRWVKANRDKTRTYVINRRSAKRRAFAAWDRELTDLVVLEASALCVLRERTTGVKWDVDHVVPIRGEKVCGLHVWNNIAVITATANRAKGNSFAVE